MIEGDQCFVLLLNCMMNIALRNCRMIVWNTLSRKFDFKLSLVKLGTQSQEIYFGITMCVAFQFL